jgi:hypothetical protein
LCIQAVIQGERKNVPHIGNKISTTILKQIFKETGCKAGKWITLTLELKTVVHSCMHGNKLSGCIKGGKFLDQLSGYQLIKDSVPCSEVVFVRR